jgi:hypothetical protein
MRPAETFWIVTWTYSRLAGNCKRLLKNFSRTIHPVSAALDDRSSLVGFCLSGCFSKPQYIV